MHQNSAPKPSKTVLARYVPGRATSSRCHEAHMSLSAPTCGDAHTHRQQHMLFLAVVLSWKVPSHQPHPCQLLCNHLCSHDQHQSHSTNQTADPWQCLLQLQDLPPRMCSTLQQWHVITHTLTVSACKLQALAQRTRAHTCPHSRYGQHTRTDIPVP